MKIDNCITNQDITKKHFLTFNPISHKYWLNESPVTGVTTINKQGYPKSERLIKWQISKGIEEYETKKIANTAANIGTLVHDYAFFTECGRNEDAMQILQKAKKDANSNKILNAINNFTQWKNNNEDTLVNSEKIIASVKYHYAGTYDRLAIRNNALILSDFKTSSGIYIDQLLQLAGYAIAIEEWEGKKIDCLEILRFGKEDGNFETKLVNEKKVIKDLKKQFIRNVLTAKFRKKYDNGN